MKKLFIIIPLILILCLCACRKDDIKTPVVPNTASDENQSGDFTETPSVTGLTTEINASTEIESANRNKAYPINYTTAVKKGKEGGDTLSGLTALEPISLKLPPLSQGESYSTEKKSHSHGPASGGEPHHTVVAFQKQFEPFGAVTLDTKSKSKVLYLTFDCGYEHDNLTEAVLDTLKEKKVPAAFFSTLDHIKAEPAIISRIINEGHIIGNHSTTHPSFPEISREKAVKELETMENYLRENYGYSTKFFRFPKGEYSEQNLDTVASLGYISVFWSVAYNDWNTENIQGKDYAVKTVMSRLHPGAIILLHSVSHDNAEALGEIIDKARSEGYEFKALTEMGLS